MPYKKLTSSKIFSSNNVIKRGIQDAHIHGRSTVRECHLILRRTRLSNLQGAQWLGNWAPRWTFLRWKITRRCARHAQQQTSKETAGDGRLSIPQKVSPTPLIFITLLGIWILEKKYCCSSRRKDVVESFGNLPSSCVALSCRIKSEDCAWKIMTGQSEIGCDYVADESPDLWQVDLQEYRSGFASILNLQCTRRPRLRSPQVHSQLLTCKHT